MSNPSYHRFAITVPQGMAAQIEQLCKLEGRNRSEFFREAVRCYISVKHSSGVARLVMPTTADEAGDNPLRLFDEWNSEADSAYDVLAAGAPQ